MEKINIRKLYTDVFYDFTPPSHIQKIIQINMSGSGDAFDYLKALEQNEDLIEYLKNTANTLTNSNIKHFDHALALIGLNNVKNCLLGIELAKMLNPGLKVLPLFKDAILNIKHAVEAEETAKRISSSYCEVAYSCGFIFDIFGKSFQKLDLSSLANTELKAPEVLINEVFNNGIRTAITAEAFAKNFKITYKKFIFAVSLLHNVGKLVLFAYSPKTYDAILTTAKNNNVNYHQAERESVDTFHNTLGSLYIRQLNFVKILERVIDFHHNISLLKHLDIQLYELACVLFISSLVVKHNKGNKNIEEFPIDEIEEELLFLKFPKEKMFEFIKEAKTFKS